MIIGFYLFIFAPDKKRTTIEIKFSHHGHHLPEHILEACHYLLVGSRILVCQYYCPIMILTYPRFRIPYKMSKTSSHNEKIPAISQHFQAVVRTSGPQRLVQLAH